MTRPKTPTPFLVGKSDFFEFPPFIRSKKRSWHSEKTSLWDEDRNLSNSVLYTGEMKAEFVRILSHVQSFFSGFPRDLSH